MALVPLPSQSRSTLPDNSCDDILNLCQGTRQILADYSMIGKYQDHPYLVHWRCCTEIAKY